MSRSCSAASRPCLAASSSRFSLSISSEKIISYRWNNRQFLRVFLGVLVRCIVFWVRVLCIAGYCLHGSGALQHQKRAISPSSSSSAFPTASPPLLHAANTHKPGGTPDTKTYHADCKHEKIKDLTDEATFGKTILGCQVVAFPSTLRAPSLTLEPSEDQFQMYEVTRIYYMTRSIKSEKHLSLFLRLTMWFVACKWK